MVLEYCLPETLSLTILQAPVTIIHFFKGGARNFLSFLKCLLLESNKSKMGPFWGKDRRETER